MSIDGLQGIGPAGEAQFAGAELRIARIRPNPSPGTSVQGTQPDSGNPPKREVQILNSASTKAESPAYEVLMQRDSELQGEVIFKYLDRAGNLAFQVPSAQAISVKRGILDEFRQRASRPATPARP